MSRYLLDTDIFTLFLQRNAAVVEAATRHRGEEVALTIITVQEVWDGWVAAISKAKTAEQTAFGYSRLTELLNELSHWSVVTFSEAAIDRYRTLKKQKLNLGANDLKIAAIALESGAVVATHNTRDFQRIPGLSVEDWAIPLPPA